MTFESLGVKPEIIKALKEDGITEPTKIQAMAIPDIKAGKDVVGFSNTGSGKTVAFGVPLLEKIEYKQGLQAMIMAPTRELAVQIANELKKFSRYHKCNIATIYGGVALYPQVKAMEKADILVGTTGRILDHMRRGNVILSDLKIIVLDEADKMADMGFIDDVETVLKQVPQNRQILLFGATKNEDLERLMRKHMKHPVTLKADSYVKDSLLEQGYYDVNPREKFSLLVHLLKKEASSKTLIFCASRASVEILERNLKQQGLKAEMIHGKLRQASRLKIIEDFNKGKTPILVASAVAARGLDIRNISHVMNYELSKDPEEYIHRIGRTARAGEEGMAITLLESRDHDIFNSILRRYPLNVKKLEKETFPQLNFQARQHGDRSFGDRPRYGGRQRFGKPSGDRPRYGGGNRPNGDRPRYGGGNRPNGDRPRYGGESSDRPRQDGDRPSYRSRPRQDSERSSGDRPQYSRPSGDRPRYGGGSRPNGDRPSYRSRPRQDSERPSGDRPQYSRPRQDNERSEKPKQGYKKWAPRHARK